MGLAESGFYNIKKGGRCLQNKSGDSVNMITCDDDDPTTVWFYDKGNQTFQNKHTRNFLENAKNCAKDDSKNCQDHKVIAKVTNPKHSSQKWTYGPTGTLCNQQVGFCLENGGASSPALSVAAYNDDNNLNKKFEIKKAVCDKSVEVQSKVVLAPTTHNLICTNTCKASDKNAEYINKYRNAGLKGYCTCNVPGVCKW